VPNRDIAVHEGTAKLITLPNGTTLDDVAGALNALGASPRDIIAIVQALKAAGALRAGNRHPLTAGRGRDHVRDQPSEPDAARERPGHQQC
jgi:hypothetical protein